VTGSTAEAYLSSPPLPDASSKPSRTWGQWVQYKITAPFESTLTAVGISYWVANMLSAGINSRVSSNNMFAIAHWLLLRSPRCSGNVQLVSSRVISPCLFAAEVSAQVQGHSGAGDGPLPERL
jgi:hypothetical protein